MLKVKTIGKTSTGEEIRACANQMWLGPQPSMSNLVVSMRGSDEPDAAPQMRGVRFNIRSGDKTWHWVDRVRAAHILENFNIRNTDSLFKYLFVIPGKSRQAIYQEIRRALKVCKQCGTEPAVSGGSLGKNCLAIAREAYRKKAGAKTRRKGAASYRA